MQNPCMGCPDRYPGCHNETCTPWVNWTKVENERKANIQKAKFSETNFFSYVYGKH